MTRSILALMLLAAALPAVAQQSTLSLDQIERKYRRMSIVHIEKCDYDHDQQFTKTEQLCVSGIYRQMYLDRN
jgi:hypothetical protein